MVYILVFSLGLMSFTVMITKSSEPEILIAGQWKELAWSYETENAIEQSGIKKQQSDGRKENPESENLFYHKGETWTFLPNGKLCLNNKDSDKTVQWSIKGRGNILQVKYGNNITEKFILTHLDENKLVLDFDSDIQARGIAKLIFEKCK